MQRKPAHTIAAFAALLLACLWAAPAAAQAMPPHFILQNPRPPREATFLTREHQPVTLSSLRGQPILLVLWASWCAPCTRELPQLDLLAQSRHDIRIVPVAVDKGGLPAAQDFYTARGITTLPLYLDPQLTLPRALNAPGLPTTLLLDKHGNEIGRFTGEAAWNGSAVSDLLTRAAAEN